MTLRVALALAILLTGGCTCVQPPAPPGRELLPYGVELSFLHPLPAPKPQAIQACAAVAPTAREHVYVYFINGLDPLYIGNLKGLCNHVKALGYRHCSCAEMGDCRVLRPAIQRTCGQDPAARVVLVGYSAGANRARDLAHELKQDGIRVALLVYVGGDTIRNVPTSKPDNVERVLNINGHGLALLGGDLLFKGEDIDGAANHRLNARHMLLPSRPETAELLAQHLLAVCQR